MDKRIKQVKKENKGLNKLAQRLVNMCKEEDSSYKPLYPLKGKKCTK